MKNTTLAKDQSPMLSMSSYLAPLILVMSTVTLLNSSAYAITGDEASVSDTIASLTLTPGDVSLNVDRCSSLAESEEFTLSGTYNNPSMTVNYTVRLIATTGSSCSHEDACDEQSLDSGGCSCLKELSNTSTISTSFTVSDLFDEFCVDGEVHTVNFFLHYTESEADPLIGLNPIEEESQAVKLFIDLAPPSAPDEAPSVTPAEEALVINAPEVGGDATQYEACVWADSDSRDNATCREITGGRSDRFEGLQNDILYNVVYRVYDNAENISGDSPVTQGTPASVLDFAEVYSGEYPGGERGGCDSSSRSHTSWLMLILTILFILCVRQRSLIKTSTQRGPYFLGVLLTLALLPLNPVHAQLQNSQSPLTSTITLSGGLYQPPIDDEFLPEEGKQRPYERVFQDQSPLMFQVQLERHLIQDKGTVSMGGSFGFWSVEGEGLSVTSIAENTELSIRPLSIYGAYRFDLYQDVFPVVPMIKAGLSYYSWTIYDGAGEVAQFVDGSEASGGTMGWFYSIGAYFLLDFLDREMAWAFDRDAGVNHSYLSFEYQSSQIDDFVDPDSFRLGTDIYLFGVTLDL